VGSNVLLKQTELKEYLMSYNYVIFEMFVTYFKHLIT